MKRLSDFNASELTLIQHQLYNAKTALRDCYAAIDILHNLTGFTDTGDNELFDQVDAMLARRPATWEEVTRDDARVLLTSLSIIQKARDDADAEAREIIRKGAPQFIIDAIEEYNKEHPGE